jgi:hypothetical protein
MHGPHGWSIGEGDRQRSPWAALALRFRFSRRVAALHSSISDGRAALPTGFLARSA